MSRSTSDQAPFPWQFLLYRLFSLSGLIPIGAFLCVHLLTNSTVLSGAGNFQKAVNSIHGLGPALPVVEWLFIFGPMLFHAGMGFLIISGAVVNVGSYPYGGNIRYTLQRATGVIAFFFILGHIMHMHHYGSFLGNPAAFGVFDPHAAASSAAAGLSSLPAVLIYIVGVAASCYHLANGLWTMGISWGVWTSAAAMKRANIISIGLGLGLFTLGMGALVGLKTLDVDQAKQVETNMREAQLRLEGKVPVAAPTAGASTAAENPAEKPAAK